MTYSRPGTSTVNALQLPQPYQPLGSPDEQRVRVTSNGPLLNYINPAQAGQNAGKDAAALSSFFESTLKVGGPILAKSLEERSQAQAAEFLSKNTDTASLYASANQEGRNLLRSLNGRAQDIVGDATARTAAAEYLQIYEANRAADRTFITPGVTSEQIVAADAKAKEGALRASGLENIPSQYLSPVITGVREGEARVKAGNYKVALEQQTRLQSNAFSAAYGKQIEIDITSRDTIFATAAASKDFSPLEEWRDKTAAYYGSEWTRVKAAGGYTQEEFAEIVMNGWLGYIAKLRRPDANGKINVDALMGALGGMEAVANSNVDIGNGVNLWDVRIGDGPGIRERVGTMWAQLQPEIEKYQREQAIAPFMPDIAAIARGERGARERAIASLGTLTGNPAAFSDVLGFIQQSQAAADTPSVEQNRNFAQLQIELNNPNRDRRAMNAAIIQTNLTWQQRADLARQNGANNDPSAEMAYAGMSRNAAAIRNAAIDIYQKGVNSGRLSLKPGESADDKISQIESQIRADVQSRTTERLKSLRASGKDVTDTQAFEYAREFADKYREAEIKKFGDSSSGQQPLQTPTQRALVNAQVIQQNLNRTGGVGTIAVFPPEVINAARQAGVPIDYRNVQRFYLRSLAGLRDANGKPLFPNPDKAYQEMVRRAQEEFRRRGGSRPPGPQSAAPQQSSGSVAAIPVVGFLQGLAQSVGLAPAPSAVAARPGGGGSGQPRPGVGQSRSPQGGQGNAAQRLLSGALGAVLGVFEQPAAAGEMPGGDGAPGGGGTRRPGAGGGARNVTDEGMMAMASLWNGGQQMTPTVPPLPQVDGAAMAQPVPMAISNPNHPFFVAIGIAEGTRTPSGGYTRAYYGHRDPGSGAWNTGTVSGQNGGNPQSVDRRWMGTLTQRQLQMAPVLQRLGLQPGSVAYNRVMFNVLDLSVQAPAAVADFVRKLPNVIAQGATIEAIAKARADSFINPATGRLQAGGFGNNYSRLFADQRSRAGAFDYKRRF